jgi:hypothetical protein
MVKSREGVRGEVGNEVGDRVVCPQRNDPLREGRMGGGRRSP